LKNPTSIIKNPKKAGYSKKLFENLRTTLFTNLIYDFDKEEFTFTKANKTQITFKKGKIPKELAEEIFTVTEKILENIQALQEEYEAVIKSNNKKLSSDHQAGGGPEGNNTTTTEHIYYPDDTDMEIPEFTMEDIQNATRLYNLLYKEEDLPSALYKPTFTWLPSPLSNETGKYPVAKLEGGTSKKYKKTRKVLRLRKRRYTKRR
jgi:hypothetical protein